MNKKIGTLTAKFLAVTQILALTLLAACTTGASVNACHATDDTANPYEEVTVNTTELLNEHQAHPNDIFPVPVTGCPATPVVVVDGMVMICHANGNSETEPYDALNVSVDGLGGHGEHADDVFPISQEAGCPTDLVATGEKVTICHATRSDNNPYNKITVSVNGLNGHDGHADDIIPAPADGCPTTRP